MAKKTEAEKITEESAGLISEQYPGGGTESEGHFLDLSNWLTDWKGRAIENLKLVGAALRERDGEIRRLTDRETELMAQLESRDAEIDNAAVEIRRQRDQINDLEKGVKDGA